MQVTWLAYLHLRCLEFRNLYGCRLTSQYQMKWTRRTMHVLTVKKHFSYLFWDNMKFRYCWAIKVTKYISQVNVFICKSCLLIILFGCIYLLFDLKIQTHVTHIYIGLGKGWPWPTLHDYIRCMWELVLQILNFKYEDLKHKLWDSKYSKIKMSSTTKFRSRRAI